MCLAIIGKIKKITKEISIVDINGIEKEINTSLVDIKIGDFVMIHAGFAIEKITQQEATEIKNDFKQ